jgi:flagellar biosynthesis/type III secretory pathway M-ring protein FliF/YscJ
MFGSNKKKQATSVEEFLKSQEAGTPSVNNVTADRETDAPRMKRWFIAPAVVAGGFLVLHFALFVKINDLKSDVAQLRLQANGGVVESLKAQVAALGSRVEKSDKEAVELKANMARLQKDLDAMKLQNMRRQKAEATAKKPAVNKKKPVKPAKRRT